MRLRSWVISVGLFLGINQNFAHAQFEPSIELSDLNGEDGFAIYGAEDNDNTGFSVSSAGDVNNDGIDDFVIGDTNAGTAGASYVVYGRSDGFATPVFLSALSGIDGVRINGVSASDQLGRSVSAAGDVNGDGIDDLILGASQADPGNKLSAGTSYVVFGKNNGLPNPLNLSNLDGFNGFSINGVAASDNSGQSVEGLGTSMTMVSMM